MYLARRPSSFFTLVLRRFVKAGDLSQSTNVPAAKDAVGALKIKAELLENFKFLIGKIS